MRKLLERFLTKQELVELLSLSYHSLSCNDRTVFRDLILGLKNLFFFDQTHCAFSNTYQSVYVENANYDSFNISYSQEYLETYAENDLHLVDPVLIEMVDTKEPVLWSQADKKLGTNNPATTLGFEFNLKDGWAHGVVFPESLDCSYFFFGGTRADGSIRNKLILSYIIPFLAKAYKRILKRETKLCYSLTPREIEVLKWLKEGKSSWEISVILNCSKRTVEFHVENIKRKLNAVNRIQAVAVGLQFGIIEF